MIIILLISILFPVAEVKSGCVSTTYSATSRLASLQYFHYANNDDCILSIVPNPLYQGGYYLEIKWIHFEVDGDLPNCKDYVEVYLTK